ncbi:MAG: CHAT domain-containing protein [Alphaproteobacteria bacterium]
MTRQENVRRWLVKAWSAGKKSASEIAQKELARIKPRLNEIKAQLASEFPDYVAFATPEPLSIKRVQTLLQPNEALVQYLTISKKGELGEGGYAWVITSEQVKWVKLPISDNKLRDHVSALRCGLDMSVWIDPSSWPERTGAERKRKRAQAKKRKQCLELIGEAPSSNHLPRFDLARSHELYQALFSSTKDLTGGKELLIVPSGPLTQLPFEVLLTKPPENAVSRADTYRAASWLGVQQAITILPSVSSLEVLRKRSGKSKADRPFAGFGNPLLDGKGYGDPYAKLAREHQKCRPSSKGRGGIRAVTPTSSEAPTGAFFIGSIANIRILRKQAPLPETAEELCSVAQSFGTGSDLWLGSRMTERAIKELSASHQLQDYRVLHFATHGLVAGDLNGTEPSLMFTPPEAPSEEDDGLLTASEAAQLKLDAEWVVMSACNTAAGDADDAEALSGLTRAFFYAGARSLLVSHWAVNSDAAVEITTGTFTALKDDPNIGRAEALRRSLKSLIAKGGVAAHPAIWAPFILVGEGGR